MTDNVSVEDAQRETREALMKLADTLDAVQRRLDAAKISFASIGLPGAVITIVGLSLAPVTGGLTLILTIVGGSFGAVSCLGGISVLIADFQITRNAIKKAEKQLRVQAHLDKRIRDKLPTLISKLKGEDIDDLVQQLRKSTEINSENKRSFLDWIKDLRYEADMIKKTASTTKVVSGLVDDIYRMFTYLSKSMDTTNALFATGAAAGVSVTGAKAVTVGVFKNAGKVGLSTAKVIGITLSGVGGALDLGAIIYYAYKLKKKEPCKVAADIRKAASCLKLKMD